MTSTRPASKKGAETGKQRQHPEPPTDTDSAAKTRIITHLNLNHRAELTRYLQHYGHLSHRAASASPQIQDLSLDTLTLTTTSRSGTTTTHTIPWSPRLTSYADARPAAVNMDREARAALGISDIVITDFVAPSPFNIFVGLLVTYTYLSLLAQACGLIVPGTWFYDVVLANCFPGGGEMYTWVQKMAALPVVVIHVGEAVWMDWKVRRFGVVRGSELWMKWVGDNALEGYGAHARFDELVRRKETEKEMEREREREKEGKRE